MENTFEQNGVHWTLNMVHVYTKHKLWLEDFVNIPQHFSLRFSTAGEYMRAKDKLLSGMEDTVSITGTQCVGSYHDVWFSAKTEKDALLWKRKVFDPMFREQAVDFYRKEQYMPYNFANVFCHFEPGDIVRFHGRLPCLEADVDHVNPLKEPEDWRIKSVEESNLVVSRRGKEFRINKSRLFDAVVFQREYLDRLADYTQEINCATKDYFDPSLKVEQMPAPEIVDVDCIFDGVIYTVALAPDRYVDVKVSAESPGLVYVMQNEDGSSVFRNDGSFVPSYIYDENRALDTVKAIYTHAKTYEEQQFLVWPWEDLSDKQKYVADFLAYESGNAVVYPFAVPYEKVTEDMLNDIVSRLSSWETGLKSLDDELFKICPLVLGYNPKLSLCQSKPQAEKQSLSEQIADAAPRAGHSSGRDVRSGHDGPGGR